MQTNFDHDKTNHPSIQHDSGLGERTPANISADRDTNPQLPHGTDGKQSGSTLFAYGVAEKASRQLQEDHKCKICGDEFRNSSKLKTHFSIHADETPYRCSRCDDKFSESDDLMVHMQWHNGKGFDCDICYEKFSELASLKTHMWIHYGKPPYWCQCCSMKFDEDSDLTRHLYWRSKHGLGMGMAVENRIANICLSENSHTG